MAPSYCIHSALHVPRWDEPAKLRGMPPTVRQASALYSAAMEMAALQHSRLLAYTHPVSPHPGYCDAPAPVAKTSVSTATARTILRALVCMREGSSRKARALTIRAAVR